MSIQPAKKRLRKMLHITISDEAKERLDEIAKLLHSTRSRMVETMVFGYKVPTPRAK